MLQISKFLINSIKIQFVFYFFSFFLFHALSFWRAHSLWFAASFAVYTIRLFRRKQKVIKPYLIFNYTKQTTMNLCFNFFFSVRCVDSQLSHCFLATNNALFSLHVAFIACLTRNTTIKRNTVGSLLIWCVTEPEIGKEDVN